MVNVSCLVFPGNVAGVSDDFDFVMNMRVKNLGSWNLMVQILAKFA